MTFEEKQIKAIRGATSDLQELNDKLDTILPPYLEQSVRALILIHHEVEDVDSIYKYLCDNYELILLNFIEILNVILDIERCGNCNEWNKQDDLEDNLQYGCKVCPTCLRDL